MWTIKVIKISSLILGILGLIILIGLYFFETESIVVNDYPINLVSATHGKSRSMFSDEYQANITVEPNTRTKPDTQYLIIIKTEIIEQKYYVSWTQLEIDINKSKELSNTISTDEYRALEIKSNFSTQIFEILPTHQLFYIVSGVFLFCGCIALYIYTHRKYEEGLSNRNNTIPPQFNKDNYVPSELRVTFEDTIIRCVNQFKPSWREKNGKWILEGGENGNNARLAQYLRKMGIPDVETEETFRNGRRADIVINNKIILECKPRLTSRETLYNLQSEIRSLQRLKGYKIYAVIYGDLKFELLEELEDEIGKGNTIILGEIVTNTLYYDDY